MLEGNVPDELAGSTELTLDLSQISTTLMPLALELRNYSTEQKPGKTPPSGITENALGSNITEIIGSNNDDYIFGTYAAETISGGAGNDRLLGGGGDDTLNGGAGDDVITTGSGSDTVDGGAGNDTLVMQWLRLRETSTGDKLLALKDDAEHGNNATKFETLLNEYSLSASEVAVWIEMDEGFVYSYYEADDVLHQKTITNIENISVSTHAKIVGGVKTPASAIIQGDENANQIIDGKGDDLLFGRGENDVIFGRGGDDIIKGGADNDHLNGGYGADTLSGEEGDDKLIGAVGDDILNGGAGDDILYGGKGADTLNGGEGFDTASYEWAGAGVIVYIDNRDKNTGNAEGDMLTSIEKLIGSKYADNLYSGQEGNNTVMYGRGGDDSLYSGEGDDKLNGGAGDDVLDSGAGADTLTGGAGDDIFKLELATDTDTVTDFGTGDKVRIFKTLRNESSLAEFGVSVDVNDKGDTILTYDSVDIMVLENFTGFDEKTHLDIQ